MYHQVGLPIPQYLLLWHLSNSGDMLFSKVLHPPEVLTSHWEYPNNILEI